MGEQDLVTIAKRAFNDLSQAFKNNTSTKAFGEVLSVLVSNIEINEPLKYVVSKDLVKIESGEVNPFFPGLNYITDLNILLESYSEIDFFDVFGIVVLWAEIVQEVTIPNALLLSMGFDWYVPNRELLEDTKVFDILNPKGKFTEFQEKLPNENEIFCDGSLITGISQGVIDNLEKEGIRLGVPSLWNKESSCDIYYEVSRL